MHLTILVDNEGADGLEAEHGFAALVEHGGRVVLFDTGTTGAAVRNAERLGVDLSRVETIALSHGHYDHTGGLEAALGATGPVRLVGHPAAFGEKTVQHGADLRDAGMSLSRNDLAALGATIETNEAPVELAPGIWLTGPVPRTTAYETVPAAFVVHRGDALVHDDMPDDQTLFVQTPAGAVVVAGCAHAGIVNTLRYVRELTDDAPVTAVFGGSHLMGADADRIGRTIDVLRELDVQTVGLCHCTGAEALAVIRAALPERFVRVHTGFTWPPKNAAR